MKNIPMNLRAKHSIITTYPHRRIEELKNLVLNLRAKPSPASAKYRSLSKQHSFLVDPLKIGCKHMDFYEKISQS